MKKCFVCERELKDHDGATIWYTSGNYGSAVYDPMNENRYLEGYVCDECLVKKKELLEEIHFQNKFKIIDRKTPDFD